MDAQVRNQEALHVPAPWPDPARIRSTELGCIAATPLAVIQHVSDSAEAPYVTLGSSTLRSGTQSFTLTTCCGIKDHEKLNHKRRIRAAAVLSDSTRSTAQRYGASPDRKWCNQQAVHDVDLA